MMKQIAILITCFNRKSKTLACLKHIYEQKNIDDLNINIFIVDGGSTDGTPEAVKTNFPQVNISVHNGLFWAGGMRAAWDMALEKQQKYDFFLLLNDDTIISPSCLQDLLKADEYSHSVYKKGGIYIGATKDIKSNNYTYGGEIEGKGHVFPNGKYQEIQLGNANIMLVSQEVFSKIGGFCKDYTHGIADYDYTLRASRAGYPILLLPMACGYCENDHPKTWVSPKAPLKERIKYLYSPKGLAYKEYMIYIRRFYPKKVLSIKIKLWMKTLFPIIWDKLKN